jgi:hypothetical protein
MENAKRMVLIDEKIVDNMFRKRDTLWKRPTEQSAKHSLSKEMRLELEDISIPEDVKAKHYQQTLSRFLNTKRKLADEPLIDLNPSPTAIDDLLELNFATAKKKKKKHKKKSITKTQIDSTRHSKRLIKPPKKFAWEVW